MPENFRTVELSDPEYEREGLRLVTVKSCALHRRTDLTVWVPQAASLHGLLILLHGVWGSHWVWTMKGAVHRTAQRLMDAGEIAPMVIAMPSDGLSRDGSGYLKWPHSEDVERWIVHEVPAASRLAAPCLATDAPVAIGGLSMGGYGALRLGARYAEHFCAVSAHSAITDISEMEQFVEEPLSDYESTASAEELSTLQCILSAGAKLPALRFDCGEEDSLLPGNRTLHQALQQARVPHEYVEHPGGHAWSYWQEHVAGTLRFADRNFRQTRSQ